MCISLVWLLNIAVIKKKKKERNSALERDSEKLTSDSSVNYSASELKPLAFYAETKVAFLWVAGN